MTSQSPKPVVAAAVTPPDGAPKATFSRPGREQPAQLHLLDLPVDLLHEILAHVPQRLTAGLRSTCRRFRDLHNGWRHTFFDRASRPPPLDDLSAFLRRLPQLKSFDLDTERHLTSLAFLAATPPRKAGSPAAGLINELPAAAAPCPALTSLSLACRNLVDLSGVEALTALRSLNLTSCSAVRLAPLPLLCPQLTSLTLTRARGGDLDLGPLTALRSLRSLAVHQADHANPDALPSLRASIDLSVLTALGHTLTSLDVQRPTLVSRGCVDDLAPLLHCTQLATLHLDCTTAVASFAALAASSASLTHLSLASPTVADIQLLGACTALVSLTLRLCALVDLDPLSACPRLTTLSLYGCPRLSDLRPLAALGPSLTTLSLRLCRGVSDITPLAACLALVELDLTLTDVGSLAPLTPLTRLASLTVEGCRGLRTQLDALRTAAGARLHIRD